MVSYQFGAVAVALGIGSAVVAGHGVASADTPEGSTDKAGATESTQTENSADTPKAEDPKATPKFDADVKKLKPKKGTKGPRSSATQSVKPHRAADAADDATTKPRPKRTAKVDTADEPKAAVVDTPPQQADTTPALAKVSTPPNPPQDPVQMVTIAVAKAFDALAHPATDHTPKPPLETTAMLTLATAARRESSTDTTTLDKTADTATTSLFVDSTPVVAIPQIAPLAFLQHIPVIGPVAVTPIVAIIHQIPVVGDVLHPFVGYPVGSGARDVKVVSPDGTLIYVHFMPASGLKPGQKAPTVLNGPGLGLPGSTSINGTPLDAVLADATGMMSVGTLRHAGYNVVTWDPRGEWNSGGRLELNSPEFEGRDMSAIISWIADQPEARLDAPGDPRIGMVGVSYGGGIQLVTAANDHRVDAIVPAITYNNLVTTLYKNAAFRSSWATPLTVVMLLTAGEINPRILPVAIYGALTGTMLPSDLAILDARNPDISKITAPTLLIQGTADTIFSLQQSDATAQTLIAKGVPTKVVWFCGGHGVCLNNPLDLRDGALIQDRTLDWLDRYVMGLPVSTGPQFEWVDQRGQWYSSNTYPVAAGGSIVTSSSQQRSLPLIPYLGGSGIPFVPIAFTAPYALNLRTEKATTTTYVVGAPKLSFSYSGTGTSTHVYAQLVDNQTGLVLSYLATPIPVTLDGATHTVDLPLEPVSYTMRPGDSVTLQLVGSAGLYATVIPSGGVLNVSNMKLTLPTADPSAVTAA
ncbi:CocE/NonD family hydrolase [Mycobacterium sp. 3519A]|uniref:S15 peptidase family protein n=1 Tax=Mycobacterium sp. 3519A TaxID=2057184 RepID=UPI001F225A6E|nr:CocE/NonD family hydrolase [Mycobacterium sp. 3519A]